MLWLLSLLTRRRSVAHFLPFHFLNSQKLLKMPKRHRKGGKRFWDILFLGSTLNHPITWQDPSTAHNTTIVQSCYAKKYRYFTQQTINHLLPQSQPALYRMNILKVRTCAATPYQSLNESSTMEEKWVVQFYLVCCYPYITRNLSNFKQLTSVSRCRRPTHFSTP